MAAMEVIVEKAVNPDASDTDAFRHALRMVAEAGVLPHFPFSCRVAAGVAFDHTWKDARTKGYDTAFCQQAALVGVILMVEKARRHEANWHPGEAEAKEMIAEIWPFTYLGADDARDAITEYVCMREQDGSYDTAFLTRCFHEIARLIEARDGNNAMVQEFRSWPFAWAPFIHA